MNFSPQIKAWIKLVCIILATGSTVTIASDAAGAKLWVSILLGLGTGLSNLYHALSDSPSDAVPKQEQTKQ